MKPYEIQHPGNQTVVQKLQELVQDKKLTITKDGLDELMETVMAVIDEETYNIYNNAYYDGFHTAYRISKNSEEIGRNCDLFLLCGDD